MRTGRVAGSSTLAAVGALGLALLTGCPPPQDDGEEAETLLSPPDEGEGLQFRGARIEVEPGRDVTWCTFINGVDAFEFREVSTAQSTGGHHVSLYSSNVYYPDGDADCGADSEFGMDDWELLTAGNLHSTLTYPDGIGVRYEGGRTVVLQAHYINATADTVTSDDALNVYFAAEGEIDHYVGMMPMLNYDIDVPPGGAYESTAECVVPGAYTAVMVFGHEHEWGTGQTIERVRGGESTLVWEGVPLPEADPFETGVIYEEPPYLDLVAGDVIRWTCWWENDTGSTLRWPQEMCVTVFVAYPNDGGLECEAGPDDSPDGGETGEGP